MFPPETTQTIFPVRRSAAATGAAPAPSATTRLRSTSSRIAAATSSRPTTSEPSRTSRASANISGKTVGAPIPSTKLGSWSTSTGSPAASEAASGGAVSDLAGIDLAARRERAQRGRDPAAEASASVRDQDGAGAREVLRDLEPDRPVPGHDRRVAEWVNEEAVHARVRAGAEDLQPGGERHLLDLRAEPLDRVELD